MGRVEGKVAFITGAARGQGRSHAIRLAEEGADIIAIDACTQVADDLVYEPSSRVDLDETVAQVEKLGRRIVASVSDVRDAEGMRAALDQGVAELGGLDIVVANAGIASFGLSTDLTEAMWDQTMDINLKGVWNTARIGVPHLVARGGGSVVFISSTCGLKGFQGVGHYVAAKHGVVGLMRTMANEFALQSVRFNTVHPTNVDTDMIHNVGTYGLMVPPGTVPTRENAIAGFSTMNGLPVPWIDPVDVSNAVLFLGSDEARYITGATLTVDAGATIK